MKKRLIVSILSAIMFVCAAAFFAACTKGNSQKQFTGFEVKASAQAEAGTEYVFETPEVMCEGKKADLSVAVSFGGKAVAHDGTKVYLESVGEYTVTYTASCDGATDTRITVLTSTDTTAPIIASTLPQNLRMEYEIVLTDYITFKEKSGIKSAVYTVMDTTAETPAELKEGQFNAETTRLYITDEAVKEITVHILVEDNVGLKSERDMVISIIPLSPYGALTFEYEWYTASVLGGNNIPYDVTTQQIGDYTAITSTFKGSWPSFSIESESLKTLAAFDYITLRHQVTYGVAGGWLGLEKQEYTTTYTSEDGDWVLRTWYKDNRGKPTEAGAGDAIWTALAVGQLKILPTTAQNVETTFTLAEITGGFNDIVIDKGDSIDLTKKVGISAEDFTASFRAKGSEEVTPITDVSAFVPQSKGTIVINVDKEGFKEATFEIGLTFTAEPAEYGNILNLNGYDAGDVYVNVSGATATVIDDSVSGGKALKIVNSGAASSTAVVTISGDAVKTVASFDYIVVRLRLSYDNAENQSVNIKITNAGEWIKPNGQNYIASNGGDGTAHELIYDRIVNGFTFDSETESFQIKLQKWNAAEQTTIITAIEGGYYDIEVEEGTAIDLTEKLGLAASDFTASFRAEGQTETTLIDNVTAFVPEKEGTIVVEVNKEGFAEATFEIAVTFTLEPSQFGTFLFDSASKRYSLSAKSGTNEYNVTESVIGDYNVITSAIENSYPKFSIGSESLKTLADFDWFTIRYKVSYSVSSGDLGLKGTSGDVYNKASSTETDGEWTLATWRKDYVHPTNGNKIGQWIWDYIEQTGIVEINIVAWNGAGTITTITVAEIVGGYDDIEVEEGQSVDLTAKFNLSTDEFTAEFTPENGEAQNVENLTAFQTASDGSLKISVNKEGFAAKEMTIAVKILTESYGVFSFGDESLYTASVLGGGNVSYNVTTKTEDGYAVITSTFTGSFPSFTIESEFLKAFASFDYITLRYKVQYGVAGGWLGLEVNSYTSADITQDGNWELRTWHKNDTYGKVGSGDAIWTALAAGRLKILPTTAQNVETTFTLAEITGGFYDVEGDGKTAIDLTEKYGSGLVQAIYTPEGGDSQTLEGEALKTFVGASDGDLQLVFSMKGFKKTTFDLKYTVTTKE